MNVAAPPPGPGGPLGPIQVIPTGLTGLLQLKQTGRLPDKLSDLVVGVVELRDWYLTSRRVNELALFGSSPTFTPMNSIGFHLFAGAVVPQNQIWYVEEMTVQVVNAGAMVATDLVRFACALAAATGGTVTNQIVSTDVADNALAARNRDIRAHADRGFWALPGDQFAVCVFDIVTTNNYTANLGIRATPCPI